MARSSSSSQRGEKQVVAAPTPARLHLAQDVDSEHGSGRTPPPRSCPRVRLCVPEVGGLPRPRLTRHLDRVLRARVAMVVAPAGYGKTTVMAQWARRVAVDVAWYRLDASDVHESCLVRNLAASVEAATGLPVPATDVASLVSIIEARDSQLVLVVDDLHLGGPPAERVLYDLLLAAPPHLAVLIGSRRLPPYNLARSELAGFTITGEELRFRREEVESLFAEVYDEPLTGEDAALLAQRTGGWAAALQIFHLSITDGTAAGRRRAIQRLRGSAGYARDYLVSEVLDGLPAELAEFVRRTCVFEEVTAGRCDRLLQRRGSQRLLEDLERWQALTSSQDGGATFRYHGVMRTHLQTELFEELGDEAATAWSHRAAEILESEGAMVEALRAYARVEDWSAVRRLAGVHRGLLTRHARAGWVAELPAELTESEPSLALARSQVAVDDGRLDEAVRIAADVADRDNPADITKDARALAERIRPWTRAGAGSASASPADWSSLLREALARRPLAVAERAARLDDPWGVLVEGIARLLAGDVARAVPLFDETAADVDEAPRVLMAARLAAAATRTDGGDSARRVASDAAAEELPWLARLARTLADVQNAAHTGIPVRPAGDKPRGDQRREQREDPWGAALTCALRCAAQLSHGRADVAALEDLTRQLRELDVPVLEAWARSALALAGSWERLPDARQEALSAEAFARAAGVPGALAMAYAALAAVDPDRQEELAMLADSTAAEVGLTFRPWARSVGEEPRVEQPRVTVVEGGALSLRCFGRFDIRVDGHAPDLARVRPRARALLRLLAVEAGRPVHRELIIDALWRDLDREAGTHNLHVSVSSLRRALEPGVPRGASRLLVRDGERYVLKLPPGSTCDLRSFDQALAGADSARAAGEIDEAVAHLTRALDLYTGEVLPEDGPEEWVLGPREQYRARAAETAAAVAELHLSQHEPGAAAAAALHSIDIDPCRDASWRLLVTSYQAGGDLAAAERARRSYAEVLASLGVVTDTASAVLPGQRR